MASGYQDWNISVMANVVAQILDFLRVRPVYGQARLLSSGYVTVHHNTETTILEVTGRGAIMGGTLVYSPGSTVSSQIWYLYIDGTLYVSGDAYNLDLYGIVNNLDYAFSVAYLNPVTDDARISLGREITFETSFKITTKQTTGGDKSALAALDYCLVPP